VYEEDRLPADHVFRDQERNETTKTFMPLWRTPRDQKSFITSLTHLLHG